MVSIHEYKNIQDYLTKCQLEDIEPSYEGWVAQKKRISKKPATTTEYDDDWAKFWSEWPTTNKFTWKGTTFEGTRSMKSNEGKCKELYLKAIEKGYTTGQLLHAKRVMFTIKMEESYRKGTNQVQYLSGMEPWLRGEVYKNWVNGKIVEEETESEYINCG